MGDESASRLTVWKGRGSRRVLNLWGLVWEEGKGYIDQWAAVGIGFLLEHQIKNIQSNSQTLLATSSNTINHNNNNYYYYYYYYLTSNKHQSQTKHQNVSTLHRTLPRAPRSRPRLPKDVDGQVSTRLPNQQPQDLPR